MNSEAGHNRGKHTVSESKTDLLRNLSLNFYQTIEVLPKGTQQAYREKQQSVAERRRDAESNETLLSRRIR
jgi:hypothetical protein